MEKLDAIIIGSGFSGMYQLYSLRDKLGLKAKVLDGASGVGGTWFWNRYPGARCDSESHTYMYYFSKDLVNEWEWSERYPQQPEILRYLNFVADKLNLRSDIELNTRMSEAHFDVATNRWNIKTENGKEYNAKYLITAVGCLSSANLPKIEGLADFKGEWYHTGQWPHEGVDFTGKRVALIGTGSTGIQATPVIASTAKHLTVFQRTPNYSLPARNAPLTPEFKKYAKQHAAEIYKIMTTNTNGHGFYIEDVSALDVSETERLKAFEEKWKMGGFQFRALYRDILTSAAANETAAEFLRGKIKEIVKDPSVAEDLADIDHPFAAKRPPIDSGYFETFNRDNVSLLNIRKTPIERITAKGVKTTTQEVEADVIVFATGFDAMTGSLVKLDITGRNNRKLKEYWNAGPRTYLGLQVPGFPNMFTITGPGSPSVLCNMPPAIEQHVEWITNCIQHMESKHLAVIETTEQSGDSWQAEVDRAANATLLPTVKHSWYLGGNVPGKPRVFMPYAGGLAHYRKICDDVSQNGFKGFEFTPA